MTFESFFTPCNTVLPSFVYCCLLSDDLLDGPRIVKIVKIVRIVKNSGGEWGWGLDRFFCTGRGFSGWIDRIKRKNLMHTQRRTKSTFGHDPMIHLIDSSRNERDIEYCKYI